MEPSKPNQSKPHSAEFFNEMRDYWWNHDFLQLMAKRLEFDRVHHVLDVGCGVGHWGRVLGSALPESTRIVGVDREDEWVRKATAKAQQHGMDVRFTYQRADAMALPFEDSTFDLVTCQTVLIHLADPLAAMREMLRVTKPGGLLLATEPCNLATISVFSNVIEQFSTDEVIATLRLHLTCQRGKQSLGEGFNNVGDLVAGMLASLGVNDLRVYMSDRAMPMYPPYDLPSQKAEVAQVKDWYTREHWVWDIATTRRYFLAGGGNEGEFEKLWTMAGRQWRDVIAAIDAGTYHCGGGSMTYLVSARKP